MIHTLLKKHFGYDEFRPLQQEIIETVLAGKDCLVLMPTGGGKSLCYQLPAVAQEGITLVISPLIALMKDQIDGLAENGITAVSLNSSLTPAEREVAFQKIKNNEAKLIYIAPERFAVPEFRKFLQTIPVKLIAIDEAHCISEWGHDFRPEYRNLKQLRTLFQDIPVIALTATATEKVRGDIAHQLNLGTAKQFVASFNRPNLNYSVIPKQQKFERICKLLRTHQGKPTIIYCFSRKGTEELAADLASAGFNAAPYHAGLDPVVRRDTQEKFIRDHITIIVATIAFGMGIDKPDIRLVIHADMPKTVEGYYQETGRAGRDGLPSECVLLYSSGDRRKHGFFIEQIVDPTEQARAWDKLKIMIDLCEGGECRRAYVLKYFGETVEGVPCGNCDICTTTRNTFDATVIAQKIISAVVRTGQRFGIGYVADVLKGSRTAVIRERGHETLSVFGIVGKNFMKQDLRNIARQLVNKGLLAQSGDMYQTVTVTEAGRAWLENRESLELPDVRGEQKTTESDETDSFAYDEALFEILRALRSTIADERGIPPFMVFGDRSLQEMAAYIPQSDESLAGIFGVGAQKLATFGPAFLSAIVAYATEHGRSETPIPGRVRTDGERTIRRAGSTYQETKLLLDTKLPLEDIARSRGVKVGTIVSHIEQLLAAGETLDISYLKQAPDERFLRIEEAFRAAGTTALSPVKEKLGDTFSYDEIRLVRLFLSTN